MITRREWLTGAAGAVAACSSAEAPTKPPNILFALADDQSYPHTGALGDPVVQTPAFDRVAAEGVLFTHSFATCPSCTPSRTSILTGRQMWRTEEGGLLYGTIPAKYPVVTHQLADAGYHVGYTGKCWAPGNWSDGGLERHPNGKEYNAKLHADPVPDGIDQRDYAANFEDFLTDRPEGDPFFFWFGCTEPHRVYEDGVGRRRGMNLDDVPVPAFLPDTERIRSDIADYYFEIEWFDQQLQKMLTKLEEIGELDNTIVVVTSDNGMPFPRAKINLYDWGVRMPLAIRWPNRIPGGRVVDDFVSHVDFAPTFLDAAGLQPPDDIDGRSLLPTLTSTSEGIVDAERDCAYAGLERHTWCRPEGATYPARMIRTRDYLYIRNFAPGRWPTGGPDFISSNKTPHGDVDACPAKTYMIENREQFPDLYELGFGKRPAEELYDVHADPGNVVNLAADAAHAQQRTELSGRLEAHLRATGDPRIEGRDIWQQAVYHQTIGFGAVFNRSLSEDERAKAGGRDSHKPE